MCSRWGAARGLVPGSGLICCHLPPVSFPSQIPGSAQCKPLLPSAKQGPNLVLGACPLQTTNLHSAIVPYPRAGPDTKKRLTTVFGSVPWGRMENAGQERPGTGSWGGCGHFQPRWSVWDPPTWPPTYPSALSLSSSAAGVLEAGLGPCSETVTP